MLDSAQACMRNSLNFLYSRKIGLNNQTTA